MELRDSVVQERHSQSAMVVLTNMVLHLVGNGELKDALHWVSPKMKENWKEAMYKRINDASYTKSGVSTEMVDAYEVLSS